MLAALSLFALVGALVATLYGASSLMSVARRATDVMPFESGCCLHDRLDETVRALGAAARQPEEHVTGAVPAPAGAGHPAGDMDSLARGGERSVEAAAPGDGRSGVLGELQ